MRWTCEGGTRGEAGTYMGAHRTLRARGPPTRAARSIKRADCREPERGARRGASCGPTPELLESLSRVSRPLVRWLGIELGRALIRYRTTVHVKRVTG
jgi:hypothetical protein